MMRHAVAFAARSAAAGLLLACTDLARVNPYDPSAPFEIDLVGPSLVQVGDTVTFTAETTPRWTLSEPPEWTARDIRVLQPLGGGRYAANAGGTTTIQVRFGPRYVTREIAVQSRAPTITGVSPDRVHSDTGGMMLVLTGTEFSAQTRIFWDGSVRPSYAESATRILFDVTAADLAAVGTHTIVAVNGPPGGGSSNPVVFTSVPPAPRLRGLGRGWATAGDPGFALVLTGDNFTPQSVVRWNGENRATSFVSASRLDIQVSAADVSGAGTAALTIVQFGDTSAAMPFPVLAGPPAITSRFVIELPSRGVVYDSTRARLYLSVPASSASHPGRVVVIDPLTGSVVSTIAVGGDPGVMVLSHNGRYLHVALVDVGAVARVDLSTGAKEFQFALGTHATCGAHNAHGMVAVPGLEKTIAVVRKAGDCADATTAVFDDGIMRPRTAWSGGYAPDRLTGSTSPDRLYAYNDDGDGLLLLTLDATGVSRDVVRTSSGQKVTGLSNIEHDSGYLFSDNSVVFDPVRRVQVAFLGQRGAIEPDVGRGRFHVFQDATLMTYHPLVAQRIGTLSIGEAEGTKELIRWGSDGLALRRDDRIVIIRTTLAGP